jgi:hypothetical protein
MHSAASGVLPRRSRVPPLDRRFNDAEPAYCQLIPPTPPSVIDSARTNEGWVLTPRHRLDRAERAKRRPVLQTTKIVCTTDPLKIGGFPIRDAFQPVGSPWRALG